MNKWMDNTNPKELLCDLKLNMNMTSTIWDKLFKYPNYSNYSSQHYLIIHDA